MIADTFPNQPHRTRIKICGIRSVEHAQAAVHAGADAIGLMFAGGSSRYLGHFDDAVAILDVLPAFITPVGVFQLTGKPDTDYDNWSLTERWVQLHGDEDEIIMRDIVRPPQRIIRGFRFDPDQVRRWNDCEAVEALLIDGPAGGSGEPFDHKQLAAMMPELSKPVILAGGLTPENVGEAIRIVRPFAVDVSSGVERSPGEKDPELIRAFCDAVRAADATLRR
jgi:phosphoribosylanthranilate isomerase